MRGLILGLRMGNWAGRARGSVCLCWRHSGRGFAAYQPRCGCRTDVLSDKEYHHLADELLEGLVEKLEVGAVTYSWQASMRRGLLVG